MLKSERGLWLPMTRVHAALIALIVVLSALAGCVHLTEDPQDDAHGPEDQGERQDRSGPAEGPQNATLAGNITMTGPEEGNETDDGEGGSGNETGNETAAAQGVSNATVYLNATADNGAGEGNGTGGGNDTEEQTASSLETMSDEGGVYRFEDVAPGEYVLQVVAPCCATNNTSVVLEAGENATVEVVLEPLDTGPDYVLEIHEWDGQIVCGAGGVNACAFVPGNDNVHDFDVVEGLKSMVVGMEWGSGQLSIALERTHDDGTHEYAREEGDGPLELRVDAGEGGDHDFDNIEATWGLRFRVFPQGTSPHLNQEFTVHYHMFYEAPAPEGYSALPEGEEPDG